MDKVTIRALACAALLCALGFSAGPALAQSALQPTQIIIGAPAQSDAGAPLTVQAVLADGQGHPISRAVVYFTTQATFLGRSGDAVLAQSITNGKGQAVATFVDKFWDKAKLSAEFRGDTQYAPSHATVEISTGGSGQVYVEHIGVDLPGFNVPPTLAPRAAVMQPRFAAFLQGLWPAMNGWPVAAVLLLVWSMYLLAVTFVFRVAALGSGPGDGSDAGAGRSR